jgi:hypothetical protein
MTRDVMQLLQQQHRLALPKQKHHNPHLPPFGGMPCSPTATQQEGKQSTMEF